MTGVMYISPSKFALVSLFCSRILWNRRSESDSAEKLNRALCSKLRLGCFVSSDLHRYCVAAIRLPQVRRRSWVNADRCFLSNLLRCELAAMKRTLLSRRLALKLVHLNTLLWRFFDPNFWSVSCTASHATLYSRPAGPLIFLHL